MNISKPTNEQIPDSGAILRSVRACVRMSCSEVLLTFTENCCLEPSAIQLYIDMNNCANCPDQLSNAKPNSAILYTSETWTLLSADVRTLD